MLNLCTARDRRPVPVLTSFVRWGATWPRLFRLGLLSLCCWGALSSAALAKGRQMVQLEYQGQTQQVSVDELATWVNTGEQSPAIATYFAQVELDLDQTRENFQIPIYTAAFFDLDSDLLQFFALQLATSVGDVNRRERRDDMLAAFETAFNRDRTVTILDIVEAYPDKTVRVGLDRLNQLQMDLVLFLERIQPIIEIVERVLPDLVCDCELPSDAVVSLNSLAALAEGGDRQPNPADAQLTQFAQFAKQECDRKPSRDVQRSALWQWGYQAASKQLADDPSATSLQFAQAATATDRSAGGTPRPRVAKRVTIVFGPLRPSFKIDDLMAFVETGDLPNGWRIYLNVANISAAEFRAALSQEVAVDPLRVDSLLNNILGEYLLFQVGQIIHTPSEQANIQALRSALVLSAIDDSSISLLEVLSHYPADAVMIEGVNLARFGFNLSRQGAVTTVTSGLENFLLELQDEVADDVCTCEESTAASDS